MRPVIDVVPEQQLENPLGGLLEIDFQDSPAARRTATAARSAYRRDNPLLMPNSLALLAGGVGVALSAGIALALMI